MIKTAAFINKTKWMESYRTMLMMESFSLYMPSHGQIFSKYKRAMLSKVSVISYDYGSIFDTVFK